MTRYFISFNDGDMTFPEEDFAAVGEAAHAVMAEAINEGIWVHGGGFWGYSTVVVSGDGSVREGPLQESNVHIGGFAIVDVDSDASAHEWARKIAVSCRCSQEVRKIMDDPEQVRLMSERKQ
ncbi:MAG: YciI family protein [Actinomycetes bacterium]